MIIKKEIEINSTIEGAWKVLGIEFADAYQWASAVTHSTGKGNSFNGATCSERGCDIVGMGKTKEKLIEFSSNNYLLSYAVSEGMPSIIKYATNSWQLFPLSNTKVKLEMTMNFTFGGLIGNLMQPMMKMMMSKMGNQMVEEFKYYVETGMPHSRKIKAMSKNKK